MKRGWFLLLALSLGLNAGLLYVNLSGRGDQPGDAHPRAGGRPPHGPPGDHPGDARQMDPARLMEDHLRRMTEIVGLDETQQASVRTLLEESVPRVMEQRRVVEAARQNLAEIFALEDLDAAAYRAATREMFRAQSRLDSLVSEAILLEASVLDHQQRELYLRTMPWHPPNRPPPPRPPARGHQPPPRRGP